MSDTENIITYAYIPSLGNMYIVGNKEVKSITKTKTGVAVFFEDDTFTEYTDVRCEFSGRTQIRAK